MPGASRSLLTRREIAALPEIPLSHPWNPSSAVHLRRLSLSIARVPPGKESFLYHRHERDEEFLLILSGRGLAEIGDVVAEIGPGDFMGFPAPDGPPHHLVNPYAEDLVYLMGGESSGLDVGHFPRIGRRLVLTAAGCWGVAEADCEPMPFSRWQVAAPPGPPAS